MVMKRTLYLLDGVDLHPKLVWRHLLGDLLIADIGCMVSDEARHGFTWFSETLAMDEANVLCNSELEADLECISSSYKQSDLDSCERRYQDVRSNDFDHGGERLT
ncbi:hypothetical protein Dimus_021060 [Dionaea muscipula]